MLFIIAKNSLCSVYTGLPADLKTKDVWMAFIGRVCRVWISGYFYDLQPCKHGQEWTVWTWHLSNIIVGTWHSSNIIVWNGHFSNLIVRTWHSSDTIVHRSHRSENTHDFIVSNSSYERLNLRMLIGSALWFFFSSWWFHWQYSKCQRIIHKVTKGINKPKWNKDYLTMSGYSNKLSWFWHSFCMRLQTPL